MEQQGEKRKMGKQWKTVKNKEKQGKWVKMRENRKKWGETGRRCRKIIENREKKGLNRGKH